MQKKVLFFAGGWPGHEPIETSRRFADLMEKHGYLIDFYDNMDCLGNADKLCEYALIVPNWSDGDILPEHSNNVSRAVIRGTGIAGWHGGLCDAFRHDLDWQFMTGGQFVCHPGNDGTKYKVNIVHGSSTITEGMQDFEVASEQYYMHVDPAVDVLATTHFPNAHHFNINNKPIEMPVAWTKYWGSGRVFYCSLGHNDAFFKKYPAAQELILRGLLWAAESKEHLIPWSDKNI